MSVRIEMLNIKPKSLRNRKLIDPEQSVISLGHRALQLRRTNLSLQMEELKLDGWMPSLTSHSYPSNIGFHSSPASPYFLEKEGRVWRN